jgi:hypothetical protein
MMIAMGASIIVVILREGGVASIPERSRFITGTLEYWFTRMRG